MTKLAGVQALHCSFCAKSQDDVRKLVAGPGVYICDECVGLCSAIVAQELARRPSTPCAPGAGPSHQAGRPPQLKAWEELSDEDLLEEMVRAHAAHENVDRAVAHHVAALRGRDISWARIGEALGMTRQSAWERFSGEE